jgi:hypothetical protein
MKRALSALAVVVALAAANGCGWQVQNIQQGNQCSDGIGCAACGGGLRNRVGNGQIVDRMHAAAYNGPPHVQGDFLTGMRAAHQQKHAQNDGLGVPGYDGATPTVTYPYYTVRGPRDFFLNDPMPLGY